MNNERELVHAAMQWHILHAHRAAMNAERLRLSKEVWPCPGCNGYGHPLFSTLGAVKAQITAIKHKERAALRVLAKTCAEQRGKFDDAEVVILDGRMAPDTLSSLQIKG